MPSDTAYLLIDGKLIEHFVSYKVTSDIFVAEDAFQLDLANPEIFIEEGQQCELYVNDQLELKGYVESIDETSDKNGTKVIVEGKDLMGLLAGTYCEEFIKLENIELKELAKRLLKKVPYINLKGIKYGKGDKDRAVELSQRKEEYEYVQIEPGQTVFDVLKNYAMSRGMLFFSMPDGTFVFGQPVTAGEPEFTLIRRKSGKGSNIKGGGRRRDISRRYSKVKVIGQKQGSDPLIATDLNVEGVYEDRDFPFYKPFVATTEYDGQDPVKYAKILAENQQFNGNQLTYTVRGHSQGTKNYQVNKVCHVIDETLVNKDGSTVDDNFLIYSRVFGRSKDTGTTTTLKLSKLGVLPT
jgi:prophage tail gpP-like protein